MDARTVEANNGWLWIKRGYSLFRLNPVIWIALFIIYLLICMVMSVVPFLGPILLNLLAPVFVAGFMLGCQALENGEELEINHLFAGFKQNTSQLITVGGLYLAGMILIAGTLFMLGGGSILAGNEGQSLDGAAKENMLLAVLVCLGLLIPLIMAYWFAPPLVIFHNINPVDAMKLSFSACMHNLLPFTVYSLISTVLFLLALVPLGLGLLVMIPTMTASLYASYQDIFQSPEENA